MLNTQRRVPLYGRRSGILTVDSEKYEYTTNLFHKNVTVIDNNNSLSYYNASGFSRTIDRITSNERNSIALTTTYLVSITREEELSENSEFYKDDSVFLPYSIIVHCNEMNVNSIKIDHLEMLRDISKIGRQHGVSLVLVVDAKDKFLSIDSDNKKMSIIVEDPDKKVLWQEIFSTCGEIIQVKQDGDIVSNINN